MGALFNPPKAPAPPPPPPNPQQAAKNDASITGTPATAQAGGTILTSPMGAQPQTTTGGKNLLGQ